MTNTRSATKIDLYAGAQIVLLRKAKGISQERLAEACGITFQQVQKYENGKNRISVSRLSMIADALDVPVEVFFPKKEKKLDGMTLIARDNVAKAAALKQIAKIAEGAV